MPRAALRRPCPSAPGKLPDHSTLSCNFLSSCCGTLGFLHPVLLSQHSSPYSMLFNLVDYFLSFFTVVTLSENISSVNHGFGTVLSPVR